jgi:hypothetical protein
MNALSVSIKAVRSGRRMTARFLQVLALAIAALSLGAAAQAQDSDWKAYKVITAPEQGKYILSIAYPTVNYVYHSCGWYGYTLVCDFFYRNTVWNTDEEKRRLYFDVDSRTGLITSIRDGGGVSVFQPFGLSAGMIQAAIATIKSEMDRHPEKYTDNDRQTINYWNQNPPEPREIVKFRLNVMLPFY